MFFLLANDANKIKHISNDKNDFVANSKNLDNESYHQNVFVNNLINIVYRVLSISVVKSKFYYITKE